MRRGRGTRDAARATRARSGRPCEPVPMDPQRTPDPEESAYDLLQRGQALLGARHHAQAAIVLQRADRLEPGKASILEALGRAYFNSGQHEEARDAFERLLDIDPSAHYAHYAVGQALKRLGDPTAAGTHLRLAVALSPETALYRQALARLGPDATPPGRTPG
jgi:tetratricopeptide (TPR) repeat protein